MADIGQAPGALAVLQAFVNTLDVEQQTDELATPAGLDQWLAGAGLSEAGGPASGPADLSAAIGLREALRAVLLVHGASPDPAGSAAARSQAARAAAARAAAAQQLALAAAGVQPAVLTAAPDGSVRLTATGSGSRPALTRLLLIAADAATAGTWSRLKACAADDCHWAFYDRSPTRNGSWCSMQICGSRAKSRAYRVRQRETTQRETTQRASTEA